MIVKKFNIEYTGGGIYVAFGELDDNTFFTISEEGLSQYDQDEYKAMNDPSYDGYTWEQEHMISSCDYTNDKYISILQQIYDKCKVINKESYDLFNSIVCK